MKLGLLLLIIAAAIFYSAGHAGNLLVLFLLCNCGIALLILTIAYFVNSPKVFRKTVDGKIPVSSHCLFWPYFLMNHLSLKLFRLTSKGDSFNEIVPGLYLGCRLGASDRTEFAKRGIRSVLDLTGEFSETEYLRATTAYLCVPVLDHCAPSPRQLEEGISYITERLRQGPVYVHCALGHSRSATFVAGYLLVMKVAASVEDAVAFIQNKRPGVRLHASQFEILKELHETRPKTG